MQNKKYLQMLGLARRAGKLAMGNDMAMKSLKSRKAKLIIFASDISPRLIEEFDRASESHCPNLVSCKVEETIDEIHMNLGYRAGVIAVDDTNFANRIIELLNQEENAYGNK